MLLVNEAQVCHEKGLFRINLMMCSETRGSHYSIAKVNVGVAAKQWGEAGKRHFLPRLLVNKRMNVGIMFFDAFDFVPNTELRDGALRNDFDAGHCFSFRRRDGSQNELVVEIY